MARESQAYVASLLFLRKVMPRAVSRVLLQSPRAVRLFSQDGEATLVRVMHEFQGDRVAFLSHLADS